MCLWCVTFGFCFLVLCSVYFTIVDEVLITTLFPLGQGSGVLTFDELKIIYLFKSTFVWFNPTYLL